MDFLLLQSRESKMAQKIDTYIYNRCESNSFTLKEQPLKGRLLVVLLNPTIFIQTSLEKETKRNLVEKSLTHLMKHPNCRLAIFWDKKQEFFHL